MINSNLKLADLIHLDYHILPIINRFGITLGVGDFTIKQSCQMLGLNADFFVEVVNVYLNDDYLPQENLKKVSLNDIIKYLNSSHNYFLSVKLKHLDEKISDLIEKTNKSEQKIAQLILNFYQEYKNELIEHINFEEEKVFPYIKSLIDNKTHEDINFKINNYIEKHTNIEDKIFDLKNLFIKYLKLPVEQMVYIEIISDLFDFEKDLNKHQIFEEKVLIPKVIELEKIYCSTK